MMWLANLWDAQLWHALPLVLAVSLVYGATRHEHLPGITAHAVRAALWLVGFLGVIFLIVLWMSWGL
jgi:hypothetical protein